MLDADLLEAVLGTPGPDKKAKEIEIKVAAAAAQAPAATRSSRRCRERLEALKERHEHGLLNSVEFLKQLLELAKDVVAGREGNAARGGRGSRQGRADRALRTR